MGYSPSISCGAWTWLRRNIKTKKCGINTQNLFYICTVHTHTKQETVPLIFPSWDIPICLGEGWCLDRVQDATRQNHLHNTHLLTLQILTFTQSDFAQTLYSGAGQVKSGSADLDIRVHTHKQRRLNAQSGKFAGSYRVSLSSHLGLEELWDFAVRRDSPSAVTST